MTAPEVADRAPPVWRSRNFRLAWTAGFVNDTGDWVLMVALPVYVFSETGSGTTTALLFVCQLLVAAVLGPIGGSLVDRLDLRRCLIGTNLAQAVTLLPLLAVTPTRTWPAFVVTVVQAALSQLNNPANVALLPRLVTTEQLTSANAALSASRSMARLIGSPLGGLVVAAGGLAPVVVVDAVSFLVAAVAVASITADTRPGTEHADHVSAGVRAGLRALAAHPPLGSVLTINGISQIAQGAFVVLFVVYVIDAVGGDGGAVGVIRGTMAVGAVAGAAVIGRLGPRVPPLLLLGVGYLGLGLVSLVFWNAAGWTDAMWVFVILFALSGFPGAALQVGLFTEVQTRSPPGTLGRVAGVLMAFEAVGASIGSILAGVLVDHLPLVPLLDAQAGVYLTCGVLVLLLARRW
jgi:predicted MFS family arabinose efflux permease